MPITNINYKCRVLDDVSNLPFSLTSPQMYIHKCDDFKILIFPSGKCRIMGCKVPITELPQLPFRIVIEKLMSVSVVLDLKESINLINLSQKSKCIWEPEIFPALRLLKFNPLCVNVFGSGKVVIVGLRCLEYRKLVKEIIQEIYKRA